MRIKSLFHLRTRLLEILIRRIHVDLSPPSWVLPQAPRGGVRISACARQIAPSSEDDALSGGGLLWNAFSLLVHRTRRARWLCPRGSVHCASMHQRYDVCKCVSRSLRVRPSFLKIAFPKPRRPGWRKALNVYRNK